MAKVSWTQQAMASLRDIHGYIARDRPRTAERTVESIVAKVRSLAGAPGRGQLRDAGHRMRVRVFTFGHFRIAYTVRPDDDGDEVLVLGVFHGLIFLPPA